MIMAFKSYDASDGVYGSIFTGLDNWITLFGEAAFWKAFRNTFILSFYGMVFGFPFPIILALFFSEIKNRGVLSVVQVFSYLPKFISTVVMVSIVTMLLRSRINDNVAAAEGPLGTFFRVCFGWTDLLNNPSAFRSIYVISGIWETGGYSSIVYFAAILAISPTNYEAAKIDGANKMQQLRYVTIPGMAGTLIIMLILNIGQLLTIGYEKVYLLQGGDAATGDSFETSQTVATYVIRTYFTGNQGIGTAADMFNSLLSMVLVLGSNKIAKKVSNTSLF